MVGFGGETEKTRLRDRRWWEREKIGIECERFWRRNGIEWWRRESESEKGRSFGHWRQRDREREKEWTTRIVKWNYKKAVDLLGKIVGGAACSDSHCLCHSVWGRYFCMQLVLLIYYYCFPIYLDEIMRNPQGSSYTRAFWYYLYPVVLC